MSSPPRLDRRVPPQVDAGAPVDPEALIAEARRRQRRRRFAIVALGLLALGSAALTGRLAVAPRHVAGGPGTPSSPVTTMRPLQLRLLGWGTPSEGFTGRGPCPDGFTVIPVLSAAGARIGSVGECDQVDSKVDTPSGDVQSTHVVLLAAYHLPGGTIRTREERTFRFARDQIHTSGRFSGRILRGTGRYAGAGGRVSGGGPGVGDRATWLVELRFR